MKKVLIGIFCIVAILFGCKKKEKEVIELKNQVKKDTTLVKKEITPPPQFNPPPDSSISIEQLTAWKSCNPLLDSLAIRYADSFKTQNAEELLRYQQDFKNAQDKICIRAGLKGGYREYKWILDNMWLEKNKKVVDSLYLKKF